MVVSRNLVLFALAVASVGSALAQSRIELYRRVVPLEATTGVISIRESFSRELDVTEKCDDGSMMCTVTRRFARVWRIDFEVETRKTTGEDVRLEREGRGTAYLALAASRADEESYDEYLRQALAQLGAAAFNEPHAGLKPDRRPFDGAVSTRSGAPSWSCFENGAARSVTQYSRDTTISDDGTEHVSGTSSSSFDGEKITGPLCSALDDVTAGAYPKVIRTMSTPRMLVEEVLSVDVSDMLQEQAYVDELVPLPDGAWLARREVPGVTHSTSGSQRGDVIESSLAFEEVETSALIMPAELPTAAARRNVWHSRWTLETVERRVGPMPERRLINSWSLTASLMPTLPPRDRDQNQETEPSQDTPFPVRLDQAAMLTSVGESLDFNAEISPTVLADAIVGKIAGLNSSGWILVLCRTDAKATWGMAPTPGRTHLLNGDEYCGTVGTYLPALSTVLRGNSGFGGNPAPHLLTKAPKFRSPDATPNETSGKREVP